MRIAVPNTANPLPAILLGIWICGGGIALSWWIRWRRISAAVQTGMPLELDIPIKSMSLPGLIEPGIFGFRPVLLLPNGIFAESSGGQAAPGQ
jgi:hypothetical protein